ncbi:MAG: GMC family oxidoreductase N-terminal domain-containing protein, partial [Geminicoccaceae bacterium]
MFVSGPGSDREYDAIVIGTGFAGAVTAARLVQAGKKICVLERGRKFEGNDFPMYPDAEALLDMDGGTRPAGAAPDLARWLWSVDQGIYDIRDLDDVVSVQAAGYGGGSLVYANVHLRAPDEVFQQGWPSEYSRKNLDPYYDRVAYMLDVRPVPSDQKLSKAKQLRGLADSDRLSGLVDAIDPPLAVTFDLQSQGKGERPWEDNQRERGACDMRGQCWLGCRKGAKNSLDFNYLRIVELDQHAHIHLGAEVLRIEKIEPEENGPRFAVYYRDRLTGSSKPSRDALKEEKPYKANYVFLAAGAINTTELLLRSKETLKPSPSKDEGSADPWPELGTRYYPNADSLAAVFDCKEPQDADRGPTITSALLHQKPRTAGKGFLWAIDFRLPELWRMPAPGRDEERILETAKRIEQALRPEADIRVGPGDGINVSLVEPPLFDVGGFNSLSGVAMLVVEGGDDVGHAGGGGLRVLLDDGSHLPFGSIINKPRKLDDWFLIEDGGYPTDIEPLLGIFRSPLWLRRNRFIETLDDKGLIEAGAMHAFGDSGPLRFPLATAMESLIGVPRRSTRVSTGLDQVEEEGGNALAALPFDISLKQLLPPWFQEALTADRAAFAKTLAPIVGQMLEAVLDDVAKQLVHRFDAMALTSNFTDDVAAAIGDIPEDKREDLVRGMLRQTIQLLWGSEVALAAQVNQLLMDRLPTDLYALANALAPLAGWLLNYREGNGRMALLLTMGRDQYRGRLWIDKTHDRLTAFLPKPTAPTSRLAQEQVLRAIAGAWQGELRTNPAWTALNRRITVHSQGGCPMCSCNGGQDGGACVCMAVTKPSGEVVGCDGLYVMDAAAFPTAVGVNPSATIAAVAEYKIDQFIEKVLVPSPEEGPTGSEWEEKRAPAGKTVADWIADLKTRYCDDVLDPLASIGRKRSESEAPAPLGLTFKEHMSGLFTDEPGKSAVDWDKLTGFD